MVLPAAGEEQQDQEKEVKSLSNDETLLNVIRPDYERPAPPPPMEPLYSVGEDGKVQGNYTYIRGNTHFYTYYGITELKKLLFGVIV